MERDKKIERHIQLGYRCKSCKKPIKERGKAGIPILCKECEEKEKSETQFRKS
jgi:ribosomal protein L37AE/L43A